MQMLFVSSDGIELEMDALILSCLAMIRKDNGNIQHLFYAAQNLRFYIYTLLSD
jgi:hypothetical protein